MMDMMLFRKLKYWVFLSFFTRLFENFVQSGWIYHHLPCNRRRVSTTRTTNLSRMWRKIWASQPKAFGRAVCGCRSAVREQMLCSICWRIWSELGTEPENRTIDQRCCGMLCYSRICSCNIVCVQVFGEQCFRATWRVCVFPSSTHIDCAKKQPSTTLISTDGIRHANYVWILNFNYITAKINARYIERTVKVRYVPNIAHRYVSRTLCTRGMFCSQVMWMVCTEKSAILVVHAVLSVHHCFHFVDCGPVESSTLMGIVW